MWRLVSLSLLQEPEVFELIELTDLLNAEKFWDDPIHSGMVDSGSESGDERIAGTDYKWLTHMHTSKLHNSTVWIWCYRNQTAC